MIIAEEETAAAFRRADAYLLLQPQECNVASLEAAVGEKGQLRDSPAVGAPQVLINTASVGGSGWESNPPARRLGRARTALKAARVTRPESLPTKERRGLSQPRTATPFRMVTDRRGEWARASLGNPTGRDALSLRERHAAQGDERPQGAPSASC